MSILVLSLLAYASSLLFVSSCCPYGHKFCAFQDPTIPLRTINIHTNKQKEIQTYNVRQHGRNYNCAVHDLSIFGWHASELVVGKYWIECCSDRMLLRPPWTSLRLERDYQDSYPDGTWSLIYDMPSWYRPHSLWDRLRGPYSIDYRNVTFGRRRTIAAGLRKDEKEWISQSVGYYRMVDCQPVVSVYAIYMRVWMID